MLKKIILTLVAAIAVIGSVAAMSAFEAHVINVTAHIENALTVEPKELDFGTVFPQEYTTKDFRISLSESFKSETRVDDVTYEIKQKPKCKADDPNTVPQYKPVDRNTHQCPPGYSEMTDLCPYLSKLPKEGEQNDTGEPSYYDEQNDTCRTVTDLPIGKLTKSENDLFDDWIVDLKVPPFEGYASQDWPTNCPVIQGANPDGTDMGCDLWIEVTGVSLPDECFDQADVMLVLDRSGSIDNTELAQLKTAAHAFVAALNPDGGVHMGQSSFATTGNLDTILTNNRPLIDANIDALISGGTTNLYEGLMLANNELAGPNDRPATQDYMILITDGHPNMPPGDPAAMALAEAAAAKAAGVIIYVVGVGNDVNAAYLQQISSDGGHYFSVGNYSDLETIMNMIANCQQP